MPKGSCEPVSMLLLLVAFVMAAGTTVRFGARIIVLHCLAGYAQQILYEASTLGALTDDPVDSSALRLAVEYVNENNLVPSVTLEYTENSTDTLAFFDMIRQGCVQASKSIVAVIGPRLSSQVKATSPVSSGLSLPQIAPDATDPTLDNLRQFPMLLRMSWPDSVLGVALVDLVEHFGWDHVSIFVSNDDYGTHGLVEFQLIAGRKGWRVHTMQSFDPTEDPTDIAVTTQLQVIKNTGARIIVLHCLAGFARQILYEASSDDTRLQPVVLRMILGLSYRVVCFCRSPYHRAALPRGEPVSSCCTASQGARIIVLHCLAGYAQQILYEASTLGARIIVLHCLAGYAQQILHEASSLGMTGAGWAWVVSDGITGLDAVSGGANGTVPEYLRGLVGPRPPASNGSHGEAFLQKWSSADPAAYPGAGGDFIGPYTARWADAVLALASALRNATEHAVTLTPTPLDCACAGGTAEPWSDGPTMLQFLKQVDTGGVTGPIRFTSSGARADTEYEIVNLREDGWQTVGSWDEPGGLTLLPGAEVRLAGGETEVAPFVSDLDVSSGLSPSVPGWFVGRAGGLDPSPGDGGPVSRRGDRGGPLRVGIGRYANSPHFLLSVPSWFVGRAWGPEPAPGRGGWFVGRAGGLDPSPGDGGPVSRRGDRGGPLRVGIGRYANSPHFLLSVPSWFVGRAWGPEPAPGRGGWFVGRAGDLTLLPGTEVRLAGGETEVAPFVSDLSSRHLQVVTIAAPGFVEVSDVDQEGNVLTGNDRFQGFCMDLLAWLSSELGFTYSLYAVSDGEYGRYREETGNWTGMVGDVVSGTADIAVAIVSITSRRQAVGDFTLPFYANGITMAMRKAQSSKSNWGFVKPFEGRLWATILMTAVAVAIFQGVANFVTKKRDPETEQYVTRGRGILGANAGFCEYMWQSWVLLVQLSPDFLPRSLSGRIVTFFWGIGVLVAISTYTANLAAFLTVSNVDSSINSPEDLLTQVSYTASPENLLKQVSYTASPEDLLTQVSYTASPEDLLTLRSIASSPENLLTQVSYTASPGDLLTQKEVSFGAVEPYASWTQFQTTRMEPYHSLGEAMEANKDAVVQSMAEGLEKARTENYALFADSAELDYAVSRQPCDLKTVGRLFWQTGFGLFLPKDSPYVVEFNRAILRAEEQGVTAEMDHKWHVNVPSLTPSIQVS
uniref:Glutamate receptor n=1 Tax=Branchiostoma floridae TaxID=7739 RepID=C3ZKA8_BRAFL|eukprot:XP_002590996.1 hypothetical protein BRAFLDRAFT_119091 [Branchiostoma floridae]